MVVDPPTFQYLDTNAHLTPCPFCGGKRQFIDMVRQRNIFVSDDNGDKIPVYFVTIHCHRCGATVHHYDKDPEKAAAFAKKLWGTRV